MTRFVSVTSELPLDARTAAQATHKLATMDYVMRPYLTIQVSIETIDRVLAQTTGPGLPIGVELEGRLKLLGVIPLWRHKLTIVEQTELMLYTNETSGPVRIWNHRLTFEPLGAGRCRYTDEIEIESGVLGAGTALFIRLFFAHRHRRWQKLAPRLVQFADGTDQ